MKKSLTIVLMAVIPILSLAQADSVIINVGESSTVIFSIGDRKDLETLKQYDFQSVVNDLVTKLENQDSTKLDKPAETYLKEPEPAVETSRVGDDDDDDNEEWEESWERRRDQNRNDYRDMKRYEGRNNYYSKRTRHSFNFDFGLNNYIAVEEEKIPDIEDYTVKQWGSWFVGLNATERTRMGRTFFLEWGGGVSWYNFKFQNEAVLMSMDTVSVKFTPDLSETDYVKSKLTACYLNVFTVPVFDFGGNSRKPMFFDGSHSESFRIGLGPYAGYRIDSYSKSVYKEEGDKRKNRNHENFYLENFRYGLRFQLGFRDADFFFNYDLNELFTDGRGPKLNAFSFGITL
jgi:hypothetical protein